MFGPLQYFSTVLSTHTPGIFISTATTWTTTLPGNQTQPKQLD